MRKNSKFEIRNSKLKFVILIGIAIVLLAAILNQQKATSPSPSPSPNISTQPKLLPQSLTEDERFILNPPPADASKSAKQKHAETVAKLAKVAQFLEIKDCKPSPLVLQVKQGTEFEIRNKDSVEHKIILDSKHIYTLPANGSKTIKAEFKYGPGDYGYVCEGTGLVGFLHITP